MFKSMRPVTVYLPFAVIEPISPTPQKYHCGQGLAAAYPGPCWPVSLRTKGLFMWVPTVALKNRTGTDQLRNIAD
ncbi:hypothetical protein HI914_07146 [Erysiphe necator]|nr:hypothetical protein HI914_07146 [Erysiphe necator]